MYSPLQEIPSIKSALGLLQVASQISYQELVEACVCYLAAVPWSQSDEKRIRNFAMSPYCPSDCSADLSARLGLGFSNTERYNILFKETQEVLRTYFLEGLDANHENARDGFSELLHRIIKEQCHGALLQGFLKEVTTQVGEIICQAEAHLAKEDPFPVDNRVYFCNGSLQDIWWILVELLGVGSARALVELIVDRPTLSALVRRNPTESYTRNMWLDAIVTIFQDVITGRLLLKAATRFQLFQSWNWMLKVGLCTTGHTYSHEEIEEITSTFIMTFPFDQQKKLICSWEWGTWDGSGDSESTPVKWRYREEWIVRVQKSLNSLEVQQSMVHGAAQSSTTPPHSSSAAASPTQRQTRRIAQCCEAIVVQLL